MGSLLLSLFFSLQVRAQGNLLVMPRRVIFDGNMKSQELNLANIGKDTARYNISILNIKMKEDGSFEVINEPDSGQRFAGKYLRFFPRSVTLAPNESQVIKLQVSRSGDMQPGEYRSHIYFRAIPDENATGRAGRENDSSISIRLVPVFGISIPVIIRTGETTAQISFTNASVEYTRDSMAKLDLLFERKGNKSVYGDLTVNLITPQGRSMRVTAVKGIAIYTPNETRHLQLALEKLPGVDYHSGRLQLVYSTPSDSKYVKFAETEIVLK